jgi:hypothetical protein
MLKPKQQLKKEFADQKEKVEKGVMLYMKNFTADL